MIAELDPGYTLHGFLANLVLTGFGAAGGFAAAWWIYRKTSQDERERFQQQLEQDRQQFQATIAHDVTMRREEDEQRRREREELERVERRRLWIAVLGELHGNLKSIAFMRANRPSRIPLRRTLLDQGIVAVSDLPLPVAEALLAASLHIDQYNSVPESHFAFADAMMVARGKLEDAAEQLGRYLKGQVPPEDTAPPSQAFD